MTERFDVIVAGIGGMGSATAYHLAKRKVRVLGLERFNIPHEMGSSHGITRIIRLAYYEHPSYLPLLRRAYKLWRQLEQKAGEQLLFITGSLDGGPQDSQVFQGSLRSCQQYDLPHEVLNGSEVNQRFPGYCLPPSTMAVWQPEGGFLTPDRCIVAHVEQARALGAEIHTCETIIDWQPLNKSGVRLRTDHGEYEADRLVITAGAWLSKLVSSMAEVAVPERQVLGWFQPLKQELFMPERFPVFNLLVEEGRYYGLPIYGVQGFKVGRYHHFNEVVDPDQYDRECHERDEAMLRSFTERYFPQAAGPTTSMRACMFTNTSDKHFILDQHPDYPQVIIGSPCSGHGFKFASVIGEVLADLAEHSQTRHDISMHKLKRLLGPER